MIFEEELDKPSSYTDYREKLSGDSPILFDEYSKHPLGTYFLTSSNGILQPFNTIELFAIISKAENDGKNPQNPFTRENLNTIVIKRIKKYHTLATKYSKITLNDKHDIFIQFIKNLKESKTIDEFRKNTAQNDIYKIALTAEHFTKQWIDKVDNNSVNARENAYKILEDKPIGSWIIRTTSITGDNISFPFSVTLKKENDYNNWSYVNIVGKGVMILEGIQRNESYKHATSMKHIFDFFFDFLVAQDLDKMIIL